MITKVRPVADGHKSSTFLKHFSTVTVQANSELFHVKSFRNIPAMSCLDLLRQQACDLRKESDAASQKYKKSVDRGFAATVEEGWELLS